ncbi:MAG: hypothetical protein AAF533_25700, partial [Acidobacteriota bacterium]
MRMTQFVKHRMTHLIVVLSLVAAACSGGDGNSTIVHGDGGESRRAPRGPHPGADKTPRGPRGGSPAQPARRGGG